MKKLLSLIAFFVICTFVSAQYQTDIKFKNSATFLNPIFAGDYPDPSILRDGNDYYIVHSSFDYYPGLLIWHSADLINWTPVNNALFKNVGCVWAPDLVKYNDKFYIYFPANNTNYVIWANSINGPWSDPIDLKISYIDPGHVADQDGKRYLYFSSGGYVQLTDDGLSTVGEFKHVYAGWPIPREWTIECFCMEGPKIVKRGEYYYLTVAEGGTAGPATSHMVISARSKSPLGPWENSPYNPIERTKSTAEKWWSKGHGTIFEDAKGKWWMVFHAYENGFYNHGRQTLLQPIEWTKDNWFKTPDNIKTDKPIAKPSVLMQQTSFTLNDNFSGKTLKPTWKFFGQCDTSRFTQKNNCLTIKPKGNSVADCSPLLTVPSNHSYMAQVEVTTEGDAIGGLVLFYNSNAHSGILSNKNDVIADLRGWTFSTEKNVLKNHVFLRLKNINNTVDMFYSLDGEKWIKIENSVDVSAYHHNVLSGFLGLRLGLCSFGNGSVEFRNFVYTPIP